MYNSTHFAAIFASICIPCTQHVSSQRRVLLLTHILRDDGNPQLLEGFWIRQWNCIGTDTQNECKKEEVVCL